MPIRIEVVKFIIHFRFSLSSDRQEALFSGFQPPQIIGNGDRFAVPTAAGITVTVIEEKNRPKNWIGQVQRFVKQRRLTEHPFSAKGTALLVIDMQRYFTDPSSHASFSQADEIVENIQQLLAAFRSCRLPLIFTRHALLSAKEAGLMRSWWGDVLMEGDPFSVIDDRLRPMVGEKVVRKTRYSAFVETDLDAVLKDLGISRVVIVGVMTHLCCESTARDAFMRDYEVFFVVDATATDDEELHLGSLRALADGFAILSTTDEVLKWME